jgi:hypothetical protein
MEPEPYAPNFELCGDFVFAGLLVLEQFIEDGAVLDHGDAELFGGGFKLAWPKGNAVGDAVVFHDAGVGDREIVGALLEADQGIAARLKKRVDQVVGFRDGGPGMVDEAGLDGVPFGSKTIPLGDAEIADIQGLHARFAVSQLGFGLARGALGKNGAVVLGAETIAEGQGFGFAALNESANDDENHDHEYKRGYDDLVIRELIEYSVELKLHGFLLCGVSATAKDGWLETSMQSILGGVAPECWP